MDLICHIGTFEISIFLVSGNRGITLMDFTTFDERKIPRLPKAPNLPNLLFLLSDDEKNEKNNNTFHQSKNITSF